MIFCVVPQEVGWEDARPNKLCADPDTTSDSTHTHFALRDDEDNPSKDELLERLLSECARECRLLNANANEPESDATSLHPASHSATAALIIAAFTQTFIGSCTVVYECFGGIEVGFGLHRQRISARVAWFGFGAGA